MASRWRHVDSSPSISAADTTLLEEDVRLLFAKVYHKISWRDFYQLVLSYAAKLPTHLVELSSGRHGHTMSAPHDSSSSHLPEPRHGSPSEHLNNTISDVSIKSNTRPVNIYQPDIRTDKLTVYMKNLPSNLTSEDLKNTLECFCSKNNIIQCQLITKKEVVIGLIRLTDISACKWLINFFQGRPYDDSDDLVECGFAHSLVW